MFDFKITNQCQRTAARCGSFSTPHGTVNTPRFMPVGTLATVKGVTTDQLAATGAQMVLSNTYHLHLQPGEGVVEAAGGLHRFMNWNGPMLTDSGGFQVFSLGDLNRIDDHGVDFRNPRDGSRILLTPERSMEIQMALGADVAMAFDQCPLIRLQKTTWSKRAVAPMPGSSAALRRTSEMIRLCLALFRAVASLTCANAAPTPSPALIFQASPSEVSASGNP